MTNTRFDPAEIRELKAQDENKLANEYLKKHFDFITSEKKERDLLGASLLGKLLVSINYYFIIVKVYS